MLPVALAAPPGPDRVGVAWGVAVTFLLIALDLQWRGERPMQLVLLAVPLVLDLWLRTDAVPFGASGGLALAAFLISAARLLRTPSYVVVVLVVGGAYTVARLARGDPAEGATNDLLLAAAMAYAAAHGFVEALRRAADHAAELDSRAAEQRQALDHEASERRAIDEAGRALHDEVLSALRRLQDGRTDPVAARAACRSAVAAVRALASPATLLPQPPAASEDGDVASLIARIQQDAPIAVQARIDLVSPALRLDEQRSAAVARAAREALRNVARHSGRDTAELVVGDDGHALQLSVVDHGRGTPADVQPGFGVTHSILAPVERLGGRAELVPTPGGGTTVRIRVPVTSRDGSILGETYGLTVRASRSGEPFLQIVGPIGLVETVIAVRESFAWPAPWVSFVLLAAFVTLGVVMTTRLVRRPPNWAWLGVVAGATLALHAVALAVTPAGALLDYRSWPTGFIALPLALLALALPIRLGGALIVLQVVLVAAAVQLRPVLASGQVPWGAYNAVISLPTICLALGWLLRGLGKSIGREQEEIARTSLELAARRSAAMVSSLHLDYTRRVVVPWLEALADDRLAVTAPGVPARAATLAVEVRDDLYAPGFFNDTLREVVADFRRRGGVLRLRPGIAPGAANRVLGRVVEQLLPGLDGTHAVTAIPPPAPDAQVRIAIVPPLPDIPDLRTENSQLHVAADGVRTVLTFPDDPLGAGADQPTASPRD